MVRAARHRAVSILRETKGDIGDPNLIGGCHNENFDQMVINPVRMPAVFHFDPTAPFFLISPRWHLMRNYYCS